jgi:hypothetical protein
MKLLTTILLLSGCLGQNQQLTPKAKSRSCLRSEPEDENRCISKLASLPKYEGQPATAGEHDDAREERRSAPLHLEACGENFTVRIDTYK